MRALPLIPYNNLQILTNGNFSSKQIDYYIQIHKICDSNGISDDISLNSFINKILHTVGNIFSRSTGYRSIDKFVHTNLLEVDEKGRLVIPKYKDAFEEGSSGLVPIPMFCYTYDFRHLNKLCKRVAYYLIGQIRELKKIKTFPVNVEKLAKKFGVCYSNMYTTLTTLSNFFHLSFQHQDTVCLISYKKQYLLPKEISIKEMTNNYHTTENHYSKATDMIKDLLRTKGIVELLEQRRNIFLNNPSGDKLTARDELFGSNVTIETTDEIDLTKNINTIIKNLYKYTYSESSFVLDLLQSKLRQYSRPVYNLSAYLREIINGHLKLKPLYKV